MTDPMKQGTAAVEHCDCLDGPLTCRKTHPDRCVMPTGKPTTPHSGRWKAGGFWASGYNFRQPEVDELQRGIDQRDTVISAAYATLREAATNAGLLTDQLKTARLGAALVPGLQQQVADLLAKINVLEHPVAEVVLYANPATQRIRLPAGKRGGGAGANGAYKLVRG